MPKPLTQPPKKLSTPPKKPLEQPPIKKTEDAKKPITTSSERKTDNQKPIFTLTKKLDAKKPATKQANKNLTKIDIFFQKISRMFPHIALKLRQANIPKTPDYFLKTVFFSSLIVSAGVTFFLWLVLSKLGSFTGLILLSFPLIFGATMIFFLREPDVAIQKKQREVNKEIVFAGRFLIIELDSGVPLYDAFKNVSKNYEEVGKYFAEITIKIDLGSQIEDALNEAIEFTPCTNFRKILWQIVNSQKTGADVTTALRSVVHNITQEQLIEVKEYGRKLNPLAMFYMIAAVILPSIGITMFIILATFFELNLSLIFLLTITILLTLMQFMFLAMMKSSRPAVGV